MDTITAQVEGISAGSTAVRWPRAAWLLLGVTILVYAPTLSYLFYDWWHNPDYSHGLFIPVVAAFLLWRKRKVLRGLPVESASFGLLIVLGSQVVFLTGYLAE